MCDSTGKLWEKPQADFQENKEGEAVFQEENQDFLEIDGYFVKLNYKEDGLTLTECFSQSLTLGTRKVL